MTLEQKVDIMLKHLKLWYELNSIINQKNVAVKSQDFKQAVVLRDEEVAKAKEFNENANALCALLNSDTNPEECDATKAK